MNQLPLRDIHLPEAVSWWPPAIGWWLLLIILLSLFFIIPRLIKRIKYKPVNKIIKIEFSKIENSYKQHKDQTRLAQDISVLLRRTCMSYQPREEVASLTGKDWVTQLNNMTDRPCFSDQLGSALFNAPYQKQSQFNSDELITSCKNWINQLPRSPLK